MTLLILGSALIAAGLALAWEVGRTHGTEQAHWQAQATAQYEAAMAPSRQRHPSAR